MEKITLIDFFTLRQQSSDKFVKFVKECLTHIGQQWTQEYGGTLSVKDSSMYWDEFFTLLCVLHEYSGQCELFHFHKGTQQMKHKTVEYMEIELIIGLWKKRNQV